MDNLRDYMQSGLFQVERREHGFKCAAITLVSKFGASHVECDFIRLGVGSVADLSFRIDKLRSATLPTPSLMKSHSTCEAPNLDTRVIAAHLKPCSRRST